MDGYCGDKSACKLNESTDQGDTNHEKQEPFIGKFVKLDNVAIIF